MPSPQAAIFHEGSQFHWFVHFAIPTTMTKEHIGAALDAVFGVATAGPPTESVGVVVGFGPTLLTRLAPGEVPEGLQDFVTIEGPFGHCAEATQTDLLLWVHGNRHDRNFEVARTARDAFGADTLNRETQGWVYRDSRDLTGFIDGTENPTAEEAMRSAVVPEGRPGAGGSFVLGQRWVHDLAAFGSLPVPEQEAAIGRTKPDSVELDPLPATSHVARVVHHDMNGDEIEIYRRSVPYGTAAEAGLYFIAFSAEQATFDLMLSHMFGTSGDGKYDHLMDFSHAASNAYYFAPSADALATVIGERRS